MLRSLARKLNALRRSRFTDMATFRRIASMGRLIRAARIMGSHRQSVLFVTSLLRAREIKMATALRKIGWKVVLIYIEQTPFTPESHFDETLRARSEAEAHMYARLIGPRVCHVFSGAVDGMLYRLCADKPGPVIVDLNDIFCPSLFDYCHDRFEPTRECLERADGLCARDLQAKSAEKIDGYKIPRHTLLFPEYAWHPPGHVHRHTAPDDDEVRVVSVGTFCLEVHGMYDSGYLRLAQLFIENRIHLHIYPHWFYRKSKGSVFNFDLKEDFTDFLRLEKQSPYIHVHQSLPLDELALELPKYDFGLISGGSEALGQTLKILKPEYMRVCYSGRISDYLDAGLPVLINREVAFNYWLLKRHGIVVDLGEILQPGFRDKLLAQKRDRAARKRAVDAASELSLDRNAHRLAGFYERVIAETAGKWARIGYPFNLARALPVVGKAFRRLEFEVQQVNQRASQLGIELETLKARRRRQAGNVPALPGASATDTPRVPARRSIERAKTSLEVERGANWADELSGLLNWPEIRDAVEQKSGMPELIEMMRLFGSGSGAFSQLSSCWQVLGFKNFNQLLRDGYRNFKRTVGCSYFNFLVGQGDPQIATLESILGPQTCEAMKQAADAIPDDQFFDWKDQKAYRYFVLLLWTYVRSVDQQGLLGRLREPLEGNPLLVSWGSELASQDLANSILEYYAMREVIDFDQCGRVMEIGAGYGRDAFVVLSLHPGVQYTIVDIPPALWIAQRYLSSVFRDRKVFTVRDFSSYEEVRQEMEEASIVFLLPHQVDMLPDRHFTASLNISSFGEMQTSQIATYIEAVDRLTTGHFYMKQWKVSQNAFDNLALTEENYPIPPGWKKLYSRTCAVQNAFFEALYQTGPSRT
jgi:putative sugar O-methyltransferase